MEEKRLINWQIVSCVAVVVVQILSIGIMIGVFKTTIGFLREQINELKEEIKSYKKNTERLIRVEDSSKSAHKRLDLLECKIG